MTSPHAPLPNDAEGLTELEQQLRAQLAEIERKKEALAREEQERLRNAGLVVTLTKIDKELSLAHFQASFKRDDVVNFFRSIPSRRFDWNTETNIVSLDYIEQVMSGLEKLPNVTIAFNNGAKEAYDALLATPAYQVATTPDDKYLTIIVGNKIDSHLIATLPGASFDHATKTREARWLVPINEGWRLYNKLKSLDKVSWTEHALKVVLSDLEKRSKLDVIALKIDGSEEIRKQLEGKGNLAELAASGFVPRPFQENGVEFIDAAGGRAVLADQMGLGKTWQILMYALLRDLRACIVCPAHLKPNWAREIKRITGETPYIMTGGEPAAHDVKRLLVDKPRFAIINYDILSRKTETYNEEVFKKSGLKTEIQTHFVWAELINLSGFDLIALDEAHYAKNTDAARTQAALVLKAPRFICATGTPLTNRPGEFWPLLTMVSPEMFPDFAAFCRAYTYNNRDAKNVHELRELLKPIMIRRLKKDVEKELPPINRITRWVELSPRAQKLCEKVLEGLYEVLAEWNPHQAGAEKKVTNMLVQIMRLKQIVAIDKIQTVADLGIEIVDSLAEDDTGAKGNATKCIIFSQFKPVAKAIAKRLGHEAVCVTGDDVLKERQRLVDEFKQHSHIKFLVATTAVASEGLNLQEAGAVVFTDLLWTPAAHEQCEGRAYGRLAHLHTIDSYYVVAENSIDQMIQKILDRKLNVINTVVEGLDSERNTSVVMELLQMMQEEYRKGKKK